MAKSDRSSTRGPRIKPKAITPDLKRKWAEMAHLFFIDALAATAPLALDRISFHGGTNLHFSRGSPRYSEDLDFLVTQDFGAQIVKLMPKIEKRMNALAAANDPDMRVEIRNRTRDDSGLLNFRVVLSSRAVVGQVMAKAEFWQVTPDYMKGYGSEFVQPRNPGGFVSRISPPIPAATLESAFADKVVALAYRPFLKWRDLFDLWWIDRQSQGTILSSLPERMEAIAHNASAYRDTKNKTLADGLQAFLDQDPEDVIAQADPDLRRWLPKHLWETLNPDGVREMVTHARAVAAEVIALSTSQPPPEDEASDDAPFEP